MTLSADYMISVIVCINYDLFDVGLGLRFIFVLHLLKMPCDFFIAAIFCS